MIQRLLRSLPVFGGLLLLVSPAARSAAAPTIDLSGYYFLLPPENPKFREVGWLELWEFENLAPERRAPLHGSLRLVERSGAPDADVSLARVARDGDRVTFASEVRNGIAYRFEGKLLVLGVLAEMAPDGKPVLSGRLEKLRGERVVASAAVSFAFTVGD